MDFVADSLVFMKKGSYVCVRFCCTDWLGNSSIIIENRVSFVLSNGGPRLRVALESRWITKDRSPQILYSRSFVVLFCTAKLFCIFGPPSSGPKCLDAACYCCSSKVIRRWKRNGTVKKSNAGPFVCRPLCGSAEPQHCLRQREL